LELVFSWIFQSIKKEKMNDFENYEIEIKGDLDPETKKELIRLSVENVFKKKNERERVESSIQEKYDRVVENFTVVVIFLSFLVVSLLIIILCK
jgi:hypothetical protein